MPFVAGELFNSIGESINQLFTTPMNAWEWQQWLLAVLLLSLFLWCCGCMTFRCCSCWRGRRRRQRGGDEGYYYEGENGSGWRGRGRRQYDNPFDDDPRYNNNNYYRSYRIMPSPETSPSSSSSPPTSPSPEHPNNAV
mmetsp:Transcript_60485/g.148401  ORF Transcript_60485/g.148401 Transcript_60485/m.148401 type:complete len:138 (-) Transcript_60485:238-651(-)